MFRKKKQDFWNFIPKRSYYSTYGRCINVTTGLIWGLFIDKGLFILSKGFSMFIPPFALMLISKGRKLFTIRFERKFPKMIEKFLAHFIQP